MKCFTDLSQMAFGSDYWTLPPFFKNYKPDLLSQDFTLMSKRYGKSFFKFMQSWDNTVFF